MQSNESWTNFISSNPLKHKARECGTKLFEEKKVNTSIFSIKKIKNLYKECNDFHVNTKLIKYVFKIFLMIKINIYLIDVFLWSHQRIQWKIEINSINRCFKRNSNENLN
jgi:hypothetical protein